MVHSVVSGPGHTVDRLRSAGLKAAVVERRWVAFGPVLRARQTWLRAQGLLSHSDDKEELVVIRAERPR